MRHLHPGQPPTFVAVKLEDMTDPVLMRGDGWVRCAICGAFHTEPYTLLATDRDGERWDVCTGQCAEEAGIDEHVESPSRSDETVDNPAALGQTREQP